MNSSLTNIGILVMVNVLFLANYFFIRSLRRIVDTRLEERNNGLIKSLSRWASSLFSRRFRRIHESFRGLDSRWCIKDVIYAVILGTTRLESTVATPFPNWQPIPFRMGIVSTSSALLLSVFLLNAGDLLSAGKVSPSSNSTQGRRICQADDFEIKIADFEAHILSSDVTNFHVGSRQRDEVLRFADALLNDTTLYGTENHACPDATFGTKKAWLDQKKDLEDGPFFPGYCEAALEEALKNARSTPCYETKREWFCLDDWGACWFGKHIEVKVPVPCKPHTYDSEERELQNYRVEQKKKRDEEDVTVQSKVSEEDLRSLKDSSADMLQTLLDQIDMAGSFYSIYVCIALFFPTPIQLYKPSLFIQAKGMLFGAKKYEFIVTVLFLWYLVKYFSMAMNTPEVKIYLSNLRTDPCFLDKDFISRRFAIVRDTCEKLVQYEEDFGLAMVQIDAVKHEVDLFSSACTCKLPGEHLIPEFMVSPDFMVSPTSNGSSWEEINFDNSWIVNSNAMSSPTALWSPIKNTTFLGDESICIDRLYAQKEILVAEDTHMSLWELWIASGLLASLLIKFSISNFGIALLKLADPFSNCDGKYECPPLSAARRNQDAENGQHSADAVLFVDDHVKAQKAKALQAIAIRESLIWGFITNTSLISLVVAAMADLDGYEDSDKTLFTIILCITFTIPFFCFLVTISMKKIVDKAAQKQREGANGARREP